jgi:NADH dehydrogenase (ubiquinone) 1 beta subcomplex subunit 3
MYLRGRASTDSLHREAWRYSGPFTRFNRFKGAFPGLGIATVAFAGYLVVEQLFLKEEHGHGHGEEHH